MEANYDEKLQEHVRKTIAEINGWTLDTDSHTGCIFFSNGDHTVYATPLYDKQPFIPVEVDEDPNTANIPFDVTEDLDKDTAKYFELIQPYLMPFFKVEIIETLARTVEVLAANIEDAIDKIEEQYNKGEIVLNNDDFIGKTISAEPE